VGLLRTSIWHKATVDISEDADLTNEVDIRDMALIGLLVPSTLNGTDLIFHVSHDNVTYYPLYDTSNGAVDMTVTAGQAYDLPTALAAWPWMKIETVTDQADTDTEFIVVSKG
jgi:hypothetical protein